MVGVAITKQAINFFIHLKLDVAFVMHCNKACGYQLLTTLQ